MRTKLIMILIALAVLAAPVRPALAASRANVTNDQAVLSFPDTAAFSATLTADAKITSVVLEYGDKQETCGEVIAKAFPQFTPDKTINVEWTWEMRQSAVSNTAPPPGAIFWWRWHYTDETGREYVSDIKTITWLDNIHKWQTLTSGLLRLHWYEGDQAFAQDLMNAGLAGLELNKSQSGLVPENPVDIYIYANTQDMKDAILYESSWVGGQAIPNYNIVIIGISKAELDWGRTAMVHELTHVLVGHLTFSCLGVLPRWLDEGLATLSEGKLDDYKQSLLDQAIQKDTLLPLTSISGDFSAIDDTARLSYAESYTIVKFLIDTYKQDKIISLLTALRDGHTIDDAMTSVYGFDVAGLEDAWRKEIGAAPRPASAQATAMPTPTFVPTIVPVSGAPLAVTPTPFAIPTSSSLGGQPSAAQSGPPIALTLLLLGCCCFLILIIGVFVVGIVVRSQNQKARNNDQAS